MFVTADCVDPEFHEPVIDSERDLTAPVPHRKVIAHFPGTEKRLTIYLPPADRWAGRFFQHVYPLTDENAVDRDIEFAAAGGGYLVQSNAGGGYRVDAAAAKFAKGVAAQYYRHTGRIFGYTWGGSGGSYQVLAGMENSVGVWDGGVPYIVGDPSSIPNNFFIRAYARILLRDQAEDIEVAVRAGLPPESVETLDPVQREVLDEVSRLGLPRQAWADHRYVMGLDAADGLFGFAEQIKMLDPSYVHDFWTEPGYLGTEESALGERLRSALVDTTIVVSDVSHHTDEILLQVQHGQALPRDTPVDVTLPGNRIVTASVRDADTLSLSKDSADVGVGDRLHLDNRWYLALAGYPRHQVPTRAGFDAYDQYRRPDGTPSYPQRAVLAGQQISAMVGDGATHTGRIRGKVIAVSNLLDADAFPWHADWYRQQVETTLGADAADHFRLWYNENADHIAPPRTERLVDFTGILDRALREVSEWVENRVEPAASSRYEVAEGQVIVGASPDRGGVQPVVHLRVDGAAEITVRVGQPFTIAADIAATDSSRITEVHWRPDTAEPFERWATDGATPEHLIRTVVYRQPGVRIAEVRVTAHRDDSGTFGGAQNLARMRVTVTE